MDDLEERREAAKWILFQLGELRSGVAPRVLAALQQLTGREPEALLREMNEAVGAPVTAPGSRDGN